MATVSILRQSHSAETSKPTTTTTTKRVTFADEVNTLGQAFASTFITTPPPPPSPPPPPPSTTSVLYTHYNQSYHHRPHPQQQHYHLPDTPQSDDDSFTSDATVSKHRCHRCRKRLRRLSEEGDRKKRNRKHGRKEKDSVISKKHSTMETRRRKKKDSKSKKNNVLSDSDQQQPLKKVRNDDVECADDDTITPTVIANRSQRSSVKKRPKTDDKLKERDRDRDKENGNDTNAQTYVSTTTKSEKKKKSKKKQRNINNNKDIPSSINIDEEVNRIKSTGILTQVRRILSSALGLGKEYKGMLDIVDAKTLYKMMMECRKKDIPKRLRTDDTRAAMIQEEQLYKALLKKRNEKMPQLISVERKDAKRKRTRLENFVVDQLGDQNVEFVRDVSKGQLEKYSLAAVAATVKRLRDFAKEQKASRYYDY